MKKFMVAMKKGARKSAKRDRIKTLRLKRETIKDLERS